MRSTTGTCNCELLVTRNSAPKQLEVSVPVAPSASRPREIPPIPAPRTEEPIYRVYAPPLVFDASNPDMPADPDPAQIIMVREAEPLATPFFEGNVEPALETATDYTPPQSATPAPEQAAVNSKPLKTK